MTPTEKTQAFPVPPQNGVFGEREYATEGITMLDHFAGLGSKSVLDQMDSMTTSEAEQFLGMDRGTYCSSLDAVRLEARLRYDYAAAMCAEKARRESAK